MYVIIIIMIIIIIVIIKLISEGDLHFQLELEFGVSVFADKNWRNQKYRYIFSFW